MSLLRKVFFHSKCLRLCRLCSTNAGKPITGYENADRALQTVTGGRVYQWLDAYEDFIGLTEVREAQTSVKKAEDEYKQIQEERRSTQQQLNVVQKKLKRITTELEKTRRGEDAYLELVTKENEIIKEEKKFIDALQLLEDKETSSLGVFSSALRESHEKERARAERMKYLSIIGSVIGACIGIIGAAISNYRRMRELRKMVTSSAEISKNYGEQILDVSKSVNEQYEKMQECLDEIKSDIGMKHHPQVKGTPSKTVTVAESSTNKINELLKLMNKQTSVFEHELQEIRKVLAAKDINVQQTEGDNLVVYVGPELKTMLEETERKLKGAIEHQTTKSVTLTSMTSIAAVAIGIAVIFYTGNS